MEEEQKTGVQLLTEDILEAIKHRRRAHVLDHPAVVRAVTYVLLDQNSHALDAQGGRPAA